MQISLPASRNLYSLRASILLDGSRDLSASCNLPFLVTELDLLFEIGEPCALDSSSELT